MVQKFFFKPTDFSSLYPLVHESNAQTVTSYALRLKFKLKQQSLNKKNIDMKIFSKQSVFNNVVQKVILKQNDFLSLYLLVQKSNAETVTDSLSD